MREIPVRNMRPQLGRRFPQIVALGCIGVFAAGGRAMSSDERVPKAFSDCPDCPEMVVVPAGSFTMGSSDDERAREGVPAKFAERETVVHKVTIARSFAMSRNEITRGMFARFV